ncbi:MAG: hypothetical protein JNM93_09190 [Bacteriovoracaceae bacterium]|nr:hypothetical protein [Bacteriovoracaceae bacterium]
MRTKHYFDFCPRCGHAGLEHLRSYSHCVNCLFVNDRSFMPASIPLWAKKEFKKVSKTFNWQVSRLSGGEK